MISRINNKLVKDWCISNVPKRCTPKFIQINCPNNTCNESLLNRPLGWTIIHNRNLAISNVKCASCDENIRLFLIDPPESTNQQEINKTTIIVIPAISVKAPFSDNIKHISPEFFSIYEQSLEAEMCELTQLSGMGYGKAIEFLIKDYLIMRTGNKEDEKVIENTPLGNCIEKYVDNPNVKQCASRAVWIGNDETHYVRKWEGKDVNDLKKLIELTVHWLEMELLTNEYTDSMKKIS